MKSSATSSLARSLGSLLGLPVKKWRFGRTSKNDAALQRFTTYCVAPAWIGAGFLDYLWHRRTRIETTSGIGESLTHSLMMIEGGPPVIAPLFLEVNAGVLTGMLAFAVVHEATVLWDLWFTAPRRPIPAGEQITHTFLEAPPFVVTARGNRHPLGSIRSDIRKRPRARQVGDPPTAAIALIAGRYDIVSDDDPVRRRTTRGRVTSMPAGDEIRTDRS